VDIDDELTDLAGHIHGVVPLRDMLDRVSQLALEVVDKSDEVSVVLVAQPHESTIGGTSDAGRALDERQRQLGRGPCLDAAYGGSTVVANNLATDERWPKYSPTAVNLGIFSSLSVPLPVQEHVVGAINWYSRATDTFHDGHHDAAREFAAKVAVVVTNAHLFGSMQQMAANMQAAMASRAVIEQAKGVLMASMRCDADTAFGVLIEQSQYEQRKLREIAEEIVSRQRRPAD
jgi:GAF domain-containing protein